ncbi:Rv3654c family TadE-like protein [Actinopolyspora mzabensis]|uniref:Rv3654c family TadE-like protein n=1 Tax=Actinopolyspora mzabensis TaxID=995066 RepID=UPI001C40B3AF|nr:Rv3654c family TadE-like protein [Actinopolyspora mzabensis]
MGRVRSGGDSGDEGSATVPAAVLTLAVLAACWLGVQFGAALVAGHRVSGAADLAALAAAAHSHQGRYAACSRAEEVARRMNVVLHECLLHGRRARVRTELEIPAAPPGIGHVSGRAMAGPVDDRRD